MVKIKMGHIIVTYKVFPEEVMDNFDELKKKIAKCLPESSSLEGYGEEPIAFGLKALLVQIKFPEDITGLVDIFENQIQRIDTVSQVQTLMVRRTSR